MTEDGDAVGRFPRRTFMAGAAGLAALVAIGADVLESQAAKAATGPWGGYSNGNIPLSALTAVIYPHVLPYAFPGSLSAVYLKPDAAAALLAMLEAYHSATDSYLGVNEGYRTLAGQKYWWDHYNHNPAMAASPGTSNHGWGAAFDLESPTGDQIAWIKRYGPAYGYTPIKSEDWHFDFSGSFTYVPPTPVSALKENDMRVIRSDNGSIAILGEFTVREYTGAEAFAYGTATQIWNGSATGWVQVTVDQYITEVRETRNRRAALLADIKALG